jgi:hypothetical protein
MSRGTADACLIELGKRMGMPALQLDDAGCCQLWIDERWLVTLVAEPNGNRLWLNCPVSAPHSADAIAASALVAMLKGNFMGQSGAAMVAAGPDGRIYLQHAANLNDSVAGDIYNAIEHLVNAAEKWSVRIARGSGEVDANVQGGREASWIGRRV